MKIFKYIALACMSLGLCACESYLDVGVPKDEVASGLAFSDDKVATASVTGVYARMNQLNYQFANVLSMVLPAMEADEFAYAAQYAAYDEYKNNAVLPSNQFLGTLWSQPYQYIAQANMCLEGLEASTAISPQVKSQLIGEAKFLRAFCYFYLVNNFGAVPLILGTNVSENNVKGRTPEDEVYTAIIDDLKDAKAKLFDGYPSGTDVDATGERIRPNKGAATALLARTYLYAGKPDLAEIEATEVINNPLYKLLPTTAMDDVFLKNSEEAIWQIQAVNTAGGRNTWEGFLIIPANLETGTALFRLIPNYLYDAFESGDERHEHWVGKITTAAGVTHKYPYKYKARFGVTPVAEYTMVLRLGEQYLIRAEARYNQGKYAEAEDDINTVRQRAGLSLLSLGNDADAVREAVEQERRVELFAEWGHRWYDLRRWPSVNGTAGKTRADDILPALKPGWQSNAIYLPLPQEATMSNPNL
ncbi:RagB/SusD family nutrient uptake outer membrane protein [Sphingobacterium phlebotomi]|uniref:RagB/SusD family nutrient uptake outer membrane protein n=1 Tax=Sphingobacterium phlebotomi TaxID=2605433 RepID=A0A5D4HCJ0_9SPHI|nr:RagB/SusD family nutrient uptake outer membrane protein [Sphingobacterium phlebotomi]TYR37843.1 RagB/SusD family nutrient uptake outer membrane protein [Sphingobacterium phlebotomi]